MDEPKQPRSRLPLVLVLLTGAMALVLAVIEIESLDPVLGNVSVLFAIALVPVGVAKLVSHLSHSARPSESDDSTPPA